MLDPDISTADALAHLHGPRTTPRARPPPVPPTGRHGGRRRRPRRAGQLAARHRATRARPVGLGGRAARAQRRRADRARHVRRQRRAQHRRADQRPALLRPARRPRDQPDGHPADRRRTPGCTRNSPSSSASGTPANWRSSRASAIRTPTCSHFNSMAKWMAGSPTGIPTSGWLGRWLDGYLGGGKDLFAAAEIGHSVPLHLIGQAQRGTAVPAGRPSFGASTRSGYRKLYAGVRAWRRRPARPGPGASARRWSINSTSQPRSHR